MFLVQLLLVIIYLIDVKGLNYGRHLAIRQPVSISHCSLHVLRRSPTVLFETQNIDNTNDENTTPTTPSPPSEIVNISDTSNTSTPIKAIEKNYWRFWKGGKDEKLFSKEALAKLGLNVLLAYGFVSNVAYITCFIIAWIVHGKTYGLSPLAPGSWKTFLLIYSGFVAINNVIRPLRYGLSLAISPLFSKFVDTVQVKTGYKKATATSIVVFLVNVVGSTSYMVLGLFLGTRLFGVPLFPRKVVG